MALGGIVGLRSEINARERAQCEQRVHAGNDTADMIVALITRFGSADSASEVEAFLDSEWDRITLAECLDPPAA